LAPKTQLCRRLSEVGAGSHRVHSRGSSAYIQYVLDRIAEADTLEKLEALLPWSVDLERTSKKVSQID
jgi:hypothetical protein